jgi:predicted HicB family RNase H-like nuclease
MTKPETTDRDRAFSGNLRLRLPVALHAHLAAQAQEQGVSLNTLILVYLAGMSGFTQEKP